MSTFQIGDVVWVKLPDFPFWPAKVVDEKNPIVTQNVLDEKEDNDILCQFYHTEDL